MLPLGLGRIHFGMPYTESNGKLATEGRGRDLVILSEFILLLVEFHIR